MTQVQAAAPPRVSFFVGLLAMAYSLACYTFFFATFLYFIGFVADAPFLPKTIDSGAGSPLAMTLLMNAALLTVFALQHSIMARPGFKRAWTLIVPKPVERSTYVLAATLAVALLIWQWRPIPATIWDISNPAAMSLLWALFGLGWSVLLLSTFLINHFELFGLQQTFALLIGRNGDAPKFHTPLFYKYVRHPLYLGFVIAFFAAPHMSAGRLLFAIGATGYILVGIFFEERDLRTTFGETYRRYQQRVPMLLPFGAKKMD